MMFTVPMTDPRDPTLCKRCGGHHSRCECADIRREAYAGVLAYVERGEESHRQFVDRCGDPISFGAMYAYSHVAEYLRALARKPEPLSDP
jgi:hypothetical protein